MKNNFFYINFLIFFLLIFILYPYSLSSQEVNLKASEVSTLEEGNIIIGEKEVEAKVDNEIEIFADKVIFNKSQNQLNAEGNVEVIDLVNKTKIKSQKIIYYKDIKKFVSFGNTFFELDNKFKGQSSDVYFYVNKKMIFSDNESSFKDNQNNKINASSFKYSDITETLKGNNIELFDNEKNRYFIEKGFLKLKDNILIGKDIKINLRNDTFGVQDNEPKLKGNSIIYKNNKTYIKKGIFTSCANNDNCPPWVITSNEIIHDKVKKEVQYNNAWLKIYNIPVLYFPKFFHPDPTVKRKSGFLPPSFGSSKNLGTSINIPYFFAISESEDFTFKPRIFSDNEFLLQSEYRKEKKNSSHILDFSLNKTNDDSENGRNTHLFANSKFNLSQNYFDESSINLKIEKVSNDNYISLYSIEGTSPIIENTSVLENLVEFSGSRDDFDLSLSFETYEKMNKPASDRYEFVYPNYSLTKSNYFENSFFDNFEIISSGNQKKYETNIYEAVQVNDFILNGKNQISSLGINHNLKSLIKNVNSDGKNSSKFKEKGQSELLSMLIYDADIPLIKKNENFENFLTPKVSFRFSPNDSKNLKDESRFLNPDNIFSLNRIGFNETIEGGTSLTIGLNYEKKEKENNSSILSSKIATVFRDEENGNLPTTSTLGEKQSDYVGDINFKPIDNLFFEYNYSLNNDFNEINLHNFKNTFQVNNFVNTFTFYEENNLIGNKSFYENEFKYKLNENNSFSFKTRNNKKDNLTEFYNLIYEYKNDCLTASIRYNKEYYTNNDLKPNEELFFNITLIPLGSTQTDSILD